MAARKSEVLQGTLELMVFKTLHGLGPLHGFGIARRIAQAKRAANELRHGLRFPAAIATTWMDHREMGRLEGEQSQSKVVLHHSARLKQSTRETEDRERIAGVIGRVLKIAEGG